MPPIPPIPPMPPIPPIPPIPISFSSFGISVTTAEINNKSYDYLNSDYYLSFQTDKMYEPSAVESREAIHK